MIHSKETLATATEEPRHFFEIPYPVALAFNVALFAFKEKLESSGSFLLASEKRKAELAQQRAQLEQAATAVIEVVRKTRGDSHKDVAAITRIMENHLARADEELDAPPCPALGSYALSLCQTLPLEAATDTGKEPISAQQLLELESKYMTSPPTHLYRWW